MHVILLLLLALPFGDTRKAKLKILLRTGKNVCEYFTSKTVYETVTTKVTTLEKYKTCCSKFLVCWKSCERSNVKEKTITRLVSKLVRNRVLHCCEGYSVDASGQQCSKPICDPACQNGGTCIGPNRCKCPRNFEGKFCHNDVNECLAKESLGCSQGCINIPGSYVCTCRRGFVPGDPASHTCKDVDECRANPCKCIGPKCTNFCLNTIGSYKCSCGNGYKMTLWNTCVDLNECIENSAICPQGCINTPGSYVCRCWPGFRWNKRSSKCEEINECSMGNGGCHHICRNVYGGHVCLCRDGFILGDDRRSCIDINECKWVTRCDSRSSKCINTPGSYYCKCKNGFKFLESHGICLDRDECSEGTSLCSQKCLNTIGSYSCDCGPGFQLDSDLKTCQDINECKARKCDHICINTAGSFRCFCNQGYTLDIDEKSCIPNLCERIQPLFFGSISCDGYTVGKKCTFSCNEGFHIDRDITRECLPSGKWSLQQPLCIPNPCKPPLPPPNGRLTLPCDFGLNSTCPVSCLEGYVLRGPDLITCQISGGAVEWNLRKVKCEEILVCKPNPCQHGGLCKIVNPTTYSCNCTGTGYRGKDCDIGVIDIEAFPKLAVNRPTTVEIRGNPDDSVQISVHPEEDTIDVFPKTLTLSKTSNTARFTVKSIKPGLKSISYEVSSKAVFETPKPSLFLVYDPSTVGDHGIDSIVNYVTNCFAMQVLYKSNKMCPDAKLLSTSTWFKRVNGFPYSSGMGVLKAGSLSFPLFLPVSDQSKVFYDAMTQLDYRVLPPAPTCHNKALNDGQLQYISKMDIFTKDFVKQVNKMLPPWFQLEIKGSATAFSEEMTRASLVSGDKMKGKKHCSSLAVDENGIFLTYLIYEGIALKIKDSRISLQKGEPLCLAVDICRSEPHLQFPARYARNLADLLTLGVFHAYKWSFTFNAVGFGSTSSEDTRKCMAGVGVTSKRMLFGNTKLEYKSKQGINAHTTGEMAVEIKGAKGKEVLDASTACIDGHSLFESPTWQSSDLGKRYQEHQPDTNIVKVTVADPKPEKSILTLLQDKEAIFKIKSGLRPSIKKISSGLALNMNYKVTKKSTSVEEGSNFDRYTNLQDLSFAAMDIESGFDMLFLPDDLTQRLEAVKNRLTSMSSTLNDDLILLMEHISDSKLVLLKVKLHYNEAKQVYSEIETFVHLAKSSIDAETQSVLTPALTSWKATLDKLKVAMKEPDKVKEFDGVSVDFQGSNCMLLPCIETTSITMRPLSKEAPWSEYCYDPSMNSFQMWDTTSRLLSNRRVGKFFTFTKTDKFHFCLSKHGVKKGEFTGRLSLLGDSLNSRFSYRNGQIDMPRFLLNVAGMYPFRVNATMKTTFKRWDMLSLNVFGVASAGSKLIQKMQNSVDNIVWNKFQHFKARKRLLNGKLQSLIGKKGEIIGRLNSNKRILDDAVENMKRTRKTYEDNRKIHEEMRKIFDSSYQDFRAMKRKLDGICKIRSCPSKCVKIQRCKICQAELYSPKTILACKEEREDRSYAYKSSIKSTCSHVVEDRSLKYTGNCKKPQTEIDEAKRIVNAIKAKIDKKQELTLEDAWNLELVNKKQGLELRANIVKANFFKSFPGKLKEGWLSEEDFVTLRKYTNETFEKSIRKSHRRVKLSLLLQEIDAKSKRGFSITKEDIAEVRKYNASLAVTLENTGKLKGVARKLQAGEKLSENEVALLKKIKPKLYEDIQKSKVKQERKRLIFERIKRKLGEGKLNATDLDDLKKIDPKAAGKVEEALKRQLKNKVNEMKSKLTNISSVISTGNKSREFAILNEKLKGIGKGVKGVDHLKQLQERINKAAASNSTVFQKVLQRFELDLEIQNVTGRSSDFERTLQEFFSALGKFDMIKILMQKEKLFLNSLDELQMWFQTAANFVKSLCHQCGETCNQGHTLKKVLMKIRSSVDHFERRYCTSARKIAALGRVCDAAKAVTAFTSRYDMMKVRDCAEIEAKLLSNLKKVSEELQNLRRSNLAVFEDLWKRSRAVQSMKQAYEALTNDVASALRYSTTKIEFVAPEYGTIAETISKLSRTGEYNLKQAEYLVVKEMVSAFAEATKLIPVTKTGTSTGRIAIPSNRRSQLVRNFNAMMRKLQVALSALCSSEPGRSMLERESERLKAVVVVASKTFKEMVDAKDVSQLVSSSQKVGAILEHALLLSERLWKSSLKCTHISGSPLKKLANFLNDARELGIKSVKEWTKDIKEKFKGIGSGIKAPVGKLIDLIKKLAENAPVIDFPITITMESESAKSVVGSFKKYLEMLVGAFEKVEEVLKKCHNCTLEEVFGSRSMGTVAKVLDKNLKRISKKLLPFVGNSKFPVAGASLIFSTLEEIRTDLQIIYKSSTGSIGGSLKKIVKAIDTVKEGLDIFLKGQKEFLVKTAGTKNQDLSIIVKELSNIKDSSKELYQKMKDPQVEEVFIKTKRLIAMVPAVTSKLEDFDKGSVSQLISTLEETAELTKDITSKIRSLYRSSAPERVKYIEKSWLPSVAASLDKINEAKENLAKYAETFLRKAGILADDTKTEYLTRKIRRRNYSSMFRGIKSLSNHGKRRRSEMIAKKSRQDESLIKKITLQWRSIYDKVVGKVDDVQARIMKLREKFYQKLAVYEDIKKAVKEIKKGSMSDIGKLKDSVEGLVNSIDNYELKKMFLSEPDVMKRKLGEVKQLFALSRNVLIKADEVIRKCSSCSVETTLGYRFVKQLASKIQNFFLQANVYLDDFSEKFSEAATDLKGMSEAVTSLKNRFQALTQEKGSASSFLSSLASAFEQSKGDLDNLFDATGNVSSILLGKDVDLQLLHAGFNGVVAQIGAVVNRSSVVAKNAEDTFKEVLKVAKHINTNREMIDRIKSGPLETRIAAAKEVAKGVKAAVKVLPKILESSSKTLESAGIDATWVDTLGSKLLKTVGSLEKVWSKTENVLDTIDILAKGKENIGKDLRTVKEGLAAFRNAPWDKKVASGQNLAAQIDGLMDNALNVISESSIALNVSMTKEGLTSSMQDLIGKENIARVSEFAKQSLDRLRQLEQGPISQVGKLTDSVDEYFESLKSFDVGDALLSDPASFKEKLGEFQHLADSAGDVLMDIANITGLCKDCSIDSVLGQGFLKKITKDLSSTFESLYEKTKSLSERVRIGKKGVTDFVKNAKKVSQSFKGILENGKITSKTFENAADKLRKSAIDLQSLKDASHDVFSSILNDENDVLKLQRNFEKVLGTVSKQMKNAGVLSEKIENAFKTAEYVKKVSNEISKNVDRSKRGPIELRAELAGKMLTGVQDILRSIPTFLNHSANVTSHLGVDSNWMVEVGNDIVKFQEGLESIFAKSDKVLKTVGLIGAKVGNITKSSKELGNDLESFMDLPTAEKFSNFHKLTSKFDSVFNESVATTKLFESALENVTGGKLNVSQGLSGIGNSLSGFLKNVSKGVDLVEGVYTDIKDTVKKIKEGPVSKVGAFKDSLEEFVESMKSQNLVEILVQSPRFAKDKITDVKDIIRNTGVVLKDVDTLIKKYCKKCDVNAILGKDFQRKISRGLKSGFDRITKNVTTFLDKLEEGGQSLAELKNAVTGIEKQAQNLKGIRFDADGLNKASDILGTTSSLINEIGNGGTKLANVMFTKNEDLQKLTGKFEGLVSFVSGFVNSTGKYVDKLGNAAEKVDEIKKSFDRVKHGFDAVREGPIEMRLEAVQKVANGLVDLTSEIPDFLQQVPLGDNIANFMRGFGMQVRDIANGVTTIVNNTKAVVGDVTGTLDSISDIGATAGLISNSFNRLMKSPFAGKISAVKDMVGQIRKLTGSVNAATGNVSSVVKKLTGKSILSSPLFGSTTDQVLSEISNAADLVFDRYQKFQSLAKSVNSAFESISSDPVNFALNDLPKLFNQADGFISTLINDTKGIAAKLGYRLDGLGLDPGLVSSAKEFYSFTKSTLGTIQNGMQLFKDFNNLFNSKDFAEGMQNFQRLIKTGGDFIGNLDDVGQRLFGEEWKGMKLDFQDGLSKIEESLGINLKETGAMLTKGLEVAGDVMGIITDVKKLLDIKKLDLDSGLKAVDSILKITGKSIDLLNKLGASISKTALTNVANKFQTLLYIYQIGKGVYDFVKWVNEACDITYETEVHQKELRYPCLKEKISIENVIVPIVRCRNGTMNVTRGFGAAKSCCSGRECIYIQGSKCLSDNARCVTLRNRQLKSVTDNQELRKAYRRYEQAGQQMQLAQFELKATETLKRRYELAYNVSVADLRINTLRISEANQRQAMLLRTLVSLKKLVNQHSRVSRIRFIKAEFSLVLHGPELDRIPLKVELKDQSGSSKIERFVVDFRSLTQSIKQIIDDLLSRLTNFNLRKRRATTSNNRSPDYVRALKCAELQDDISFLHSELQNLVADIQGLKKRRSSKRRLRQTEFVKKSRTPAQARRQLINEVQLLNVATATSSKLLVENWLDNFQEQVMKIYGQQCFDLTDCLNVLIAEISSKLDSGFRNRASFLDSLTKLTARVATISRARFEKSELLQLQRSTLDLQKSAAFCRNPPVLHKRLPMSATAYLGEELSFSCRVVPSTGVTYLWYLNGTALPAFNEEVLTISDIGYEHEGSYHCEAANDAGTLVTKKVFVSVMKRLSFLAQPKSIAVPRSKPRPVHLTCNTTSSETVSYAWWHQTFSGSIRKLSYSSQILTINAALRSTNGLYWCEASNGFKKLRSRKAAVALVRSTRKNQGVRMIFPEGVRGERCADGGNVASVKSRIETAILNGVQIKGYKSTVHVDRVWHNRNKGNGSLVVDLVFEAARSRLDDALDLAVMSSEVKYKIQKIVENFLYVKSDETLHFHEGSCSYKLQKSDVMVKWGLDELSCPPGMGESENNLLCESCLPGHFENSLGGCSECPVGTYQPRIGARDCIPCGKGLLTAHKGSIDHQNCVPSDFKCYERVNILIALDTTDTPRDSSKSHMKDFMKSILHHFLHNHSPVKISVSTFGSSANLVASHDEYNSLSDILALTSKIRFEGTQRRTDLLLHLANSLFDDEQSDDHRKVLLVISRGAAQPHSDRTKEQVEKLKSIGVEIFYMAAGRSGSKNEAMLISSSPKHEHIFSLPQLDGITSISTLVANSVCNSNSS